MIGFIYAPIVALIVWYAAVKLGLGFDIAYWQALVGVLVAKVLALYLKNDNDVIVTVVNAKNTNDNPKEDE